MKCFALLLVFFLVCSVIVARKCGPNFVENIVKDICKYQGNGGYSYEDLVESNALHACCRRKCSSEFLKKFCR